ncbi:MAG: CDP-alcohol phosphatidyltransferase family protein [Crocinitomicaceae bacterium]
MNILRHPIYNMANLLTVCNLLLGVFSIFCSLNGKLDWACYALLIAMACDFLDGMLARILKVSGDFGKQLDSLADMVSFGVAPGTLMFVMIIIGIDVDAWKNYNAVHMGCQLDASQFAQIKIQQWADAFFYNTHDGVELYNPCVQPSFQNPYDASIKYLPFLAFLIPLFSMLRLAKFNIDVNQTESFVGVPTPMSTFFFMFFPLFFYFYFLDFSIQPLAVHALFDCYSLAGIVFVFSPLMMAPIHLIALKFKTLNFKENAFRFSLVGLSLISIPIFQLWSLPIILILYIGLSILQRILTHKK